MAMKMKAVYFRVFFLIVLLVLAGLPAMCQQPSHTSQKPNILLIVSEDHGAHLSCYGDQVIQTPHLDNIAKEGMLFRNAYVTQSVCSPSRSSILTGLYPHQNGHLGLATQGYRFVGDVKNVYRLLKEAGYRTGMIGKLHLNPEAEFPIDFHPIKGSNFEKKGLQRYSEHADTFIKASEEPFFLMVNLPDAHFPFQDVVEGRPADPVSPDEIVPFPYIGVDNERIRKVTTNYYNCLLRLDQTVGEVMSTLEASGKKDNTLVIYLSDHGDEMARGKFDVYEASTKIPFLVSWSGKVPAGVESEALISTIDIVPTMLDVAGVSPTKGMTGKSLLALFGNPDKNFRKYLFTEYNCDPVLYFPRRAVRDKKYKLVYSLLSDRQNPTAVHYTENRSPALEGSPTVEELKSAPDSIQKLYAAWIAPPQIQLYDLERDPWEFRDLATDPAYAKVKQRMLSTLQAWMKKTDDPLRFPDRLNALTREHDSLHSWGMKTDWKYPEYLYGIKPPALD